MKALILGITIILVAVLAVLPIGMGWGEDVLSFLKGALPVFSGLIGLIMVFTGISDIKDRAETRKEDAKKESTGSGTT